MPRRRLPPRLYLDAKRQQWVIRDGPRFIRTGAGEGERGEADRSLAQYIGRKYKPEPSGAPVIADVLAVYADEVAPHKKTARHIGYCLQHLLKEWGTRTVAEVSAKTCRAYAAGKPPMAAQADLKVLKVAIDHWNREYGPLTVLPTFWLPKGNPPKERWLTKHEAARLLNAARPYLHIRRLILLGLYTGSRPGVLALRWDQIDLRAGILHRLPLGSPQDAKKRAPPVRLGRRIAAHLARWRRLDGPDIIYVCHFDGRATDDPHATWRRVIKAAKLPGVTRHTLRHTQGDVDGYGWSATLGGRGVSRHDD